MVKWIDLAILIAGSALAVIAGVQYGVKYAKALNKVKRSGILAELDQNGEPLGDETIEQLRVKYGIATEKEAAIAARQSAAQDEGASQASADDELDGAAQ